MRTVVRVPVLVVGGGPAGLTVATRIARTGTAVLVCEREAQAGGVPRHCAHPGFGWRDLHRSLSGPDYARRLVGNALDAGVELRTRATVTGWTGPRAVEVTSPHGLLRVEAGAVVLATGARERPRPARLLPGDRPEGVLTTGTLQQLVHLEHRPVGSAAVVVGAELVSWSAVLTLRAAGVRTVALVSEHERPAAGWLATAMARAALRVPVVPAGRVSRVIGHGRVEAVEIEQPASGRRRTVACDTLVLTAGWVAENELARRAGLACDRASGAVAVDGAQRTGVPGVLAAGNLVHPVTTADIAALDGVRAAATLADAPEPPGPCVELCADPPFRWIAPARWTGEPPPRGRLLVAAAAWLDRPVVQAVQGGAVVGSVRLARSVGPGAPAALPARLLAGVDPTGDVVHLRCSAAPTDSR